MRLALIGSSCRLGRLTELEALQRGHAVVGLSRHATAAPATNAHHVTGDALDAATVDTVVRLTDAVIFLVGPVSGGPADVCSRSIKVLLDVMHAANVKRLVAVTGALSGPTNHLGVFYKAMLASHLIDAAIADRHLEETLILRSDLDYTLVRPPRLTDGPASTLRVEQEPTIHLRDHASRRDVAKVLVDAAAERLFVRQAIYVVSGAPTPQ